MPTKSDSADGSCPREWRAAERLLQRFEDAWRGGIQPELNDYLPEEGSNDRVAVLLELVHIDLERRLESGNPIRVESYLDRYPRLSEDPGKIVDLIESEFTTRRRHEPDLGISEFRIRFPCYADELAGRLSRLAISKTPRINPPSSADPGVNQPNLPKIDGYEVLEILGRGSMGVVYKARCKRLNRLVALKMIRFVSDAEEEQRDRFQREAEAGARLQHPHIVQIFETGMHEGCPFLSLELVDGPTLAQHLAGVPQPAPRLGGTGRGAGASDAPRSSTRNRPSRFETGEYPAEAYGHFLRN